MITDNWVRIVRVVADCCSTTSTQCHLLTELGRTGPQPLNELGQRLILEKSWVSRAVDGLAELGLVRKEPNPEDARSWIVALTPEGTNRVQSLNATLNEHAEQLLQTLPVADREVVKRSLNLLLDALRADRSATCCLPAPERKAQTCC